MDFGFLYQTLIQDHSDHCASKEQNNLWPDSFVPLVHHDQRDLGLIKLVKAGFH